MRFNTYSYCNTWPNTSEYFRISHSCPLMLPLWSLCAARVCVHSVFYGADIVTQPWSEVRRCLWSVKTLALVLCFMASLPALLLTVRLCRTGWYFYFVPLFDIYLHIYLLLYLKFDFPSLFFITNKRNHYFNQPAKDT